MSHISEYLTKAVSLGASDIHICEKSPIKVRVDGDILILDEKIPNMKKIFDEIMGLCLPEQKEKFLSDLGNLNDVCFSFESPENNVRLRITIYRDEYGICIALRIIPLIPMNAESLGIPKAAMEVCNLNSGLFLVTGASGSGKSTTLAAMISLINETKNAHIITIEDPIEYIIPPKLSLINHREIGRHTQSFKTGLHWVVREDPNVVVLGELRDVDSMRAAINIAETGHLVLATMHTRSSAASVDRFISSFPAEDQNQIRLMLADNLIGVLAQTLIPKIGGGMVGAFEVLLNNDAMKNNIREQKIYQIENVLQTGQKQGMISMEDYIIELIRQGDVSYKAALNKTHSREKLKEKYERLFEE